MKWANRRVLRMKCISGSIAIPDSVRVIEKLAFFHCEALERVAISWGVEQIGESAFHFCDALANIHLPASVTILGKLAFTECRSLSEISIPGSVQTIYRGLCFWRLRFFGKAPRR